MQKFVMTMPWCGWHVNVVVVDSDVAAGMVSVALKTDGEVGQRGVYVSKPQRLSVLGSNNNAVKLGHAKVETRPDGIIIQVDAKLIRKLVIVIDPPSRKAVAARLNSQQLYRLRRAA